MKVHYALCLSVLLLFSGCDLDDDQKVCNVSNPTENLPWLKAKKEELQTSINCHFIDQGEWRGITVFIFGTCSPLISSVLLVYDCEGNLLCPSSSAACPTFQRNVRSRKTIWRNGK
ncbi:hypothetical protein [Rufibacter sp. LB8]|uniref:hypothetical protein n=1 Tax=Rufibacter sp. LB8 TaxID=2777781 RepID=UPI00178C4389|nr:hypothetical protein [Rufibacter sp. LB8]